MRLTHGRAGVGAPGLAPLRPPGVKQRKVHANRLIQARTAPIAAQRLLGMGLRARNGGLLLNRLVFNAIYTIHTSLKRGHGGNLLEKHPGPLVGRGAYL